MTSFLKLILNFPIKIKELNRKLIDDELKETKLETDDDLYTLIDQKVIRNSIGMKSVRLDILAESENTLYNIEMQRELDDNFAKRVRFYQGMIDSKLLLSGKDVKYDELPETYIIFITNKDYFGLGYPIYTMTERCYQNTNLEMNDGTVKIFINLSSKRENFEKLKLLPNQIEKLKTKADTNKYVKEQRTFNYTKEFYNKLYDLIDVFNGKKEFSEKLDKDVKNIMNAIERIRKDERVISMTTAMGQLVQKVELDGLQRGGGK